MIPGKRFQLGGAIVAALLILLPILGMSTPVSAQATNDPEAFLADAQAMTGQLDPIADQLSFSITQTADSIPVHTLTADSAAVQDFYLEFTVTAPNDGTVNPFDFGLFFRDLGDDYYALILSSGGSRSPFWRLGLGQSNADPQVVDGGDLPARSFPLEDGTTYDIVVAAIGDRASFSVNGTAIIVLDISQLHDAGNLSLASGFFTASSFAGTRVRFSNVTLFDLSGATIPVSDSTPTPGASGNDDSEKTGDRHSGGLTTGEADYTSPAYGYTLAFDESWEILDQQSRDGFDVVNLSNGVSDVLIFGQPFTKDAKACVDSDIDYFSDTSRNDGQYTLDSIATDQNGKELTGPTSSGGYFAVLWITETTSKGDQEKTVYVECRPIVDGESMLLIEQYVDDADYNDQIAARKALLAGLTIGAVPANTRGTESPEDAPTPPAANTDGDVLAVSVEAIDRSGVSGTAMLSPSGSTRTKVVVSIDGAPEGALVILQEGSCKALSGTADFEAGSLDADGSATARIHATPEELSGNYALTIIDPDTEDYETPLACGNI